MRRRSSQGGMTLIEVLFAIVLLSFGLLAIAPLFASSVKNGASSNQLTNANTLAREKLEELIGYPATDPRLAVPTADNAAGPSGLTTIGTGSVVGHNTACDNDLPTWYTPAAEAVSRATASPGPGWYQYPFSRTYTIEQFGSDLTTRVTTPATPPATYFIKRITVTVRATMGPFPGLRQTKQTVWVRYRDAS